MENLVPQPQVRVVLRCRDAATPALLNEAAARWVLRHVAFNAGFELRPTADGQWSHARYREAPLEFELCLDMRDCRFMLHSEPALRRIELQVLLGPGARHLRRNVPRLVEDLAAACMADVESIDLAAARPVLPRRPAAEPLVLPA
jgi:hypothetical protein